MKSQLGLILVVASSVSAQNITVEGETLSLIGVRAEHPAHAATQNSLPMNRKFTKSLSVRTDSGDCFAELVSSITGGKVSTAFRGRVAGGNGTGTSWSFNNPSAMAGTVRFGFVFKSDKPVKGRLVVTMTPQAASWWDYTNRVAADVVVGNEVASTDSLWAETVTKEFAVTLDQSGTLVDVGIKGDGRSLSPKVDYDMTVDVSFVPGHQVTSFGESCGQLWTSFPSQDTLDLTYQMGLQNSPTLLIVGIQKTVLPLPPAFYGCKLLVEPIAIFPGANTNGLGLATSRIKLPNVKADFLMQVIGIELQQPQLLSTSGIELRIDA